MKKESKIRGLIYTYFFILFFSHQISITSLCAQNYPAGEQNETNALEKINQKEDLISGSKTVSNRERLAEMKNFLKENYVEPENEPLTIFGKVLREKMNTGDLLKIYRDKNTDSLLKFFLFQCLGNEYAEISEEEQDDLYEEAYNDTNPKIRILANVFLKYAKEYSEEEAAVEEEAAGELYDKYNNRDPLISRYVDYMRFLEIGEFENASKAFEDEDPNIRFLVAYQAANSSYLNEDGEYKGYKESPDSLFFKGLGSNDIWVRFFSAVELIENDSKQYGSRAKTVFSDLLEDIIKNNDEAVIDFIFPSGDLSIPLDAWPEKAVMERMFRDPRPTVRYKLAELLKYAIEQAE